MLTGAVIAGIGAAPEAWNTISEAARYDGYAFGGLLIGAGNLVMLAGGCLLFYGFVRSAIYQFQELHHYPKQ